MADENRQSKDRVRTTAVAALELVPFAMLIVDSAGRALAVNDRWLGLAQLSHEESLGAGWLSALEDGVAPRLRDLVTKIAHDGDDSATVDLRVRGEESGRWVRWWFSRHEVDGVGLVAVAAADVDADYSRLQNLYHLATHDSLTGLINRSHFMECIDQAMRRSQRTARHVGVVYVDLDDFKRINDEGGHLLGDRVLYAIGARLRHAVRSADMVARIGGDEFAVLCEGLSASEQAEVVARRIAQALAESVDLDGARWAVAASVGAAVDRGAHDSAEDLVDRADRAMYSVKLVRRREPEAVGAGGTHEDAPLDPAVTAIGGRGSRYRPAESTIESPEPRGRMVPNEGHTEASERRVEASDRRVGGGERRVGASERLAGLPEGVARPQGADELAESAADQMLPGRRSTDRPASPGYPTGSPDLGFRYLAGEPSFSWARQAGDAPVYGKGDPLAAGSAGGPATELDAQSAPDPRFGTPPGRQGRPLPHPDRPAQPADRGPVAEVPPTVRAPGHTPERRPEAGRPSSGGSSTMTGDRPSVPASRADAAQTRLVHDVATLRHSLDSIRLMLDRLVESETGVIDIRDEPLSP